MILSACKEIVEIVIGKKAAEHYQMILNSVRTVFNSVRRNFKKH